MAQSGVIANPRLRGALVAVVSTVIILVITQVVFPGGRSGGGTPPAILFSGLVTGLLNSLIAVGIILIYRSSRIINFAQGALGAAGGVFAYNLTALLNWPFMISFIFGLAVAALLGLVVEISFIRRFFNAPRLVLTVLTIALLAFLQQATGFISLLPIFPSAQDRTTDQLIGRAPINLPFRNFAFNVGDYPLKFGFAHVLAIALSVAALVGVGLFLRYSRLGIAIRASSENSDRSRLLGINVGSLSMTVWTIAGFLSGLGVILSGAITGSFAGTGGQPQLLMTSLVASVLARMRSLPVAIGSAVGISVLRESVKHSFEKQLTLVDVGLFVAVLVGLLVQRDKIQRSELSGSSSWKANEEYRSMPKEMLGVSAIKIWRRVLISLGLLVVLGFPWVAAPRQTNLGGYLAIVAIVALSLVVLTGWAGQVSLGQFAFVAVGAVVGGAIAARYSFWIALPIAPIVTAGFAMLVGLPALRIKGLFLGITTFALAFAIQASLFQEEYFGWLLPERVDRPTLMGLIDFEDERSMYYLALISLVLTILLLSTLRRSRPGRVLIALRENEANIQSFGINVVRTRLAAFALSGFICGFAGLLLAVHQRAVQQSSFSPQLSLDVFLFSVVGGVGSIAGTLMGSLYFALNQFLDPNSIFAFFTGRVGVIALLYFVPGGLGQLFFGLRDGILRIVAQRRQMVVPSLFADYDPLAMMRKLIPLSEPTAGAGLAALPFNQRYKAPSHLYGDRGKLIGGTSGTARAARDTAAFGAAAKAAEESQLPETSSEMIPETPTTG